MPVLPNGLRSRLNNSPLSQPSVLVELFALSNIAFLAVDIALAHSINGFAHPAEWVPLGFSILAPLVLVAATILGGLSPTLAGQCSGRTRAARVLGLAVGWSAIAVGIAGFLLHLESAFFGEQTLKNLIYTAPFVAPLSYSGVGFLLLLNRMVDPKSLEWARWSVLLALGGFVGNFVLTLADHAQNGFFLRSEWVGVIASAWAVSSLCAVVIFPRDRPLVALTSVIMAFQVMVGVLGFYFHVIADLRAPATRLFERFLYGAPLFAPLLFADLAMLAAIALWAVVKALDAENEAPIPLP